MSFNKWLQDFVDDPQRKLTLPKSLKTGNIKIVRTDGRNEPPNEMDQNLPFRASNTFTAMAQLISRIYHPNGKEVLILDLEAQEIKDLNFEPGDTIGVLPKNSYKTISTILSQLRFTDSDADAEIKLENSDSKKQYLPQFSTIRIILEKYVNFKGIPMKQMLVTLASYTTDATEKSALQFLSSKEGAETYKTVILDAGVDFFSLFTKFPSCRPPVEGLIEILPRLLPRPYSIASSKSVQPKKIRIVLSILPFEKEGVCTGMFRTALSERNSTTIDLYLRKSHGFRLPVDDTIPLILVGPGTGLAPFLGFLDEIKSKNSKKIIYLFTGFQFRENYFCKYELEDFLDRGFLTHLFVAFSKEADEPKYVQDAIKSHWKELGNLIVNEKARIYECGELRKMALSISDAFTQVLETYLDINSNEAKLKLQDIKNEGRYLQDTWC